MKSTRKKIDCDMWQKIYNQIHYEFVTYDVRQTIISFTSSSKGISLPVVYSIKTQIYDKMWNEV
jgi:hypothetical protein